MISSSVLVSAVAALLSLEVVHAAPGAHYNASASYVDKRSSYKLQDKYQGSDFFDGWDFYTGADPSNGLINLVGKNSALSNGYAYVESNSNRAVIKVDSYHDLARGQKRNSVRLISQNTYNGGLFVLDADQFPFGCAVWPAFWLLGPNWPNDGEIDIFEGVNLDTQNKMTAHTRAGCTLSQSNARTNPSYTVSTTSSKIVSTSCGPSSDNVGCQYRDKNVTSFGKGLNAAGGAVIVTEWNDSGIRIWNFPRGAIPTDLTSEKPQPWTWSSSYLKAAWYERTCAPKSYFKDMQMIFDITLCGDWAGATYASSGCPGSCTNRVMKGSNFQDAVWKVNSVKVFQWN